MTVINDKGHRRKVLTYLATQSHVDDRLKPYSWYKEHVLAGAEEHGLPTDYVAEFIQPIEATEDPNQERARRDGRHAKALAATLGPGKALPSRRPTANLPNVS